MHVYVFGNSYEGSIEALDVMIGESWRVVHEEAENDVTCQEVPAVFAPDPNSIAVFGGEDAELDNFVFDTDSKSVKSLATERKF